MLFFVFMMGQACHTYYMALPGKKPTTQETAQNLDSLQNQTGILYFAVDLSRGL